MATLTVMPQALVMEYYILFLHIHSQIMNICLKMLINIHNKL